MNDPFELDISIVVPAFNEDESIPELTEWIKRVLTQHNYTYEVVLIDDGSTDQTATVIRQLAKDDPCIKGIFFRRNYGKSAALHTGFQLVKGRVVITMDADLQDSPDELPGLYKRVIDEGYDLVSGWKKKRFDPISKTLPSKFFNAVTRKISGIKLNDFNCGLKAYRNEVVKNIHLYGEMHRYIPVIAKWKGFDKIGEQIVQHRARKYGVTKFGLERFIFGFLDLMSITFVGKFRKRPMHFFGTMGILSFMFGFFITSYLIAEKIYYNLDGQTVRQVTDQPLFFLALVALILGSQLFLAGFLGESMASFFNRKEEYAIKEKVNI